MAHTEVLTDVPADRVDQLVEDFEGEGATVSKVQQADGRYTVTATFPDHVTALTTTAKTHGIVQHASLAWNLKKH